jgi:DNA-binding transcriptional MerR regulator
MVMKDTKPSYNLKVIVRETGIKPDALRAWEKRYNLPVPGRTSGGHRLYSQRDIDTIKWLMARQEEGLSISHAVQLWRDIEAGGRDPLQGTFAPSSSQDQIPVTAAKDLATIREAWLRACLEFDEATAEHLLSQALAQYAPELVCLEILQKGLSQIGLLWYENKATVQQEHFASAVAVRRVHALLAAAPRPGRSQLVHLVCPPLEEHTFPSLLLALLLRYRGWRVAYFGANVPISQMESALQATQPELVVLTAQTLPAAAEAFNMAHFSQSHLIPAAYGGLIFNRSPEIRQKMPGYFLGETLSAATESIAEILTGNMPMPAGTPVAATYREALTCFDRQRPLLEWHVMQIMQSEKWPEAHLKSANVAHLHFAQHIRAALILGDLALVNPEITWLSGLLSNYGQIPEGIVMEYLSAYHQAAQEYLDQACLPVIEWLAAISAGRR